PSKGTSFSSKNSSGNRRAVHSYSGKISLQSAIILTIVTPLVNIEKVVFYRKKVPASYGFFEFGEDNARIFYSLFAFFKTSPSCNPQESRVQCKKPNWERTLYHERRIRPHFYYRYGR